VYKSFWKREREWQETQPREEGQGNASPPFHVSVDHNIVQQKLTTAAFCALNKLVKNAEEPFLEKKDLAKSRNELNIVYIAENKRLGSGVDFRKCQGRVSGADSQSRRRDL